MYIAGMDAVGPELSSLCRAVRDLLEAQERLIATLNARGMLDSRASGVLAALDQLKAEADETRRLADTHPVGC
ncbi:hypothetical protein Aau02nite_06790 [Amorphoplanes auranticolor]|uniref:Uncharacterized protein n=2 Tax=Actinoplanes auranticolor TaxID=47988 RepID=A0A919VGG5_9ACTN|nr:hypothetical protein Aau02nite_06790 [Actinoplanes auranticolor]